MRYFFPLSFQRLKISLNKRQNTWIDLRNSIAKKSNIEFFFLLGHRGFGGELDFRFDKGELDIIINTAAETASKKKDLKQLSGGERSFGTACLLFSLWNSLATPFFCLDEFDVYMVRGLCIF